MRGPKSQGNPLLTAKKGPIARRDDLSLCGKRGEKKLEEKRKKKKPAVRESKATKNLSEEEASCV